MKKRNDETYEIKRVRVPKGDEVIGVVSALLGSGRMLISCKDGKERVCRIPGRIRKRIWIKEGDIVLVAPWSVSGDKRGDILYRYNHIEIEWLKRHKIIE